MTEHTTSITGGSSRCSKGPLRRLASTVACIAALTGPVAADSVSCPGYEDQEAQGKAYDAFIRGYVDCFNNRDFTCLDQIYAADLTYEGQYWTLSSKEEFFDFYRKAWRHLAEHITVLEVRSAGDKAFVDLQNHIEVFKDYPDFPSRALKAGDVLNLEGTVAYTIKDNRITHICDR